MELVNLLHASIILFNSGYTTPQDQVVAMEDLINFDVNSNIGSVDTDRLLEQLSVHNSNKEKLAGYLKDLHNYNIYAPYVNRGYNLLRSIPDRVYNLSTLRGMLLAQLPNTKDICDFLKQEILRIADMSYIDKVYPNEEGYQNENPNVI